VWAGALRIRYRYLLILYRLNMDEQAENMNNWLETLREALNLVKHGVVLLDDSFTARFINHAFHRMWALPEAQPDRAYTWEDLVRCAQEMGNCHITANELPDYARYGMALVEASSRPPMYLRLLDGRAIKFECILLSGGGRMLTYTDETVFIRAIEQLQVLATTDDLTRIHNRRFIYASGQAEVDRARRYGHPLSVVLLDADNFKKINDTYGHAIGDEVLVFIANCCRENVRATDHVGRVGGEEFALMLIETSLDAAIIVAEKLCRKIASASVRTARGAVTVTASFGVASMTADMSEFSELLNKADQALYVAKNKGRNRVVKACS
jgi:diguanylate cyclase (GGDEF)-like protein